MSQPPTHLPDDELFAHVARAAFDRVETGDGGTPVQRAVVGVHVALGLIGNRGLFDHDADDAAGWIEAFEFLALPHLTDLLREASTLRGFIEDDDNDDEPDERLEDLTDRFFTLSEGIPAAAAQAIRSNPSAAFDGIG